MKSGGGVLSIAGLQILVGICLLGIYEGYKARYLKDQILKDNGATDSTSDADHVVFIQRNLMFRTPLDYVFYASLLTNIFSILGVAGVLHQQRELVMAFFTYNICAMVAIFHFFVDICADVGLRYSDQSQSLDSYEQSAAAFLFFSFILSVAATLFGVRAMDEMKQKRRDEYTRLAVLSDALQFEPDVQP